MRTFAHTIHGLCFILVSYLSIVFWTASGTEDYTIGQRLGAAIIAAILTFAMIPFTIYAWRRALRKIEEHEGAGKRRD